MSSCNRCCCPSSTAEQTEMSTVPEPGAGRESTEEEEKQEKEKQEVDWWVSEDIIRGAKDGAAFSGDQRKFFCVSPDGEIEDHDKWNKSIEEVRELRGRITEDKMRVLSIDEFKKKELDPKSIVHLKGFAHEVEDKCDSDILKALNIYQVLVWDGDGYDETGFTRMVPKFLDANSKAECIAFKIDYEIDVFKKACADLIERYPGRITLVRTDLTWPSLKDAKKFGVTEEMEEAAELATGEDNWGQEYFLLGRVACHVTQSLSVISLGGGGITRHEAKAGIARGMTWEIFNLRRRGQPKDEDGFRDEEGNALMDWVQTLENDPSIDKKVEGLKNCLRHK